MKIKKYILTIALIPTLLWAQDRVIVVGGIQHEGLFPTDMSEVPTQPDWAKITHLSNTYLDLGMRWEYNEENQRFRGLEVVTRAEFTEWPMLGYDANFGGHGISHLHIRGQFRLGQNHHR